MNHEVGAQVARLYRELDAHIASFQGATGLRCPAGCGQCCESPEVETTPLEMLPMALEIWRSQKAHLWLDKTYEADNRCVFYQPDEFTAGNGRCLMYLWRPTICRLFAFATVDDKQGRPRLAACIRHKQVMAEEVAMAQVAIAQGLSAPNFSDWQARVAGLLPQWGYHQMPINQALQVAINHVGLLIGYETADLAESRLSDQPLDSAKMKSENLEETMNSSP